MTNNEKAWMLWTPGETLTRVDGFEPVLAQWEAKTHRAQQRLDAYLESLWAKVGPLPPAPELLSLHLDVDVHDEDRLTQGYDLENYLTPLFGRQQVDGTRFVLVSAHKRVGEGSCLTIGRVHGPDAALIDGDWTHFAHPERTGAGHLKHNLRDALRDSGVNTLPPGQVEVVLAWRCGLGRNWVNLWKATGDGMGPVLGEPNPKNPFDPDDGRIVHLALHRYVVASMEHAVEVGLWWRSLRASTT